MNDEESKHVAEEKAAVSARRTKPRNLIKMVLEESNDAEQEEKLEHENDEDYSGQESGSSASFVQGSGETGAYHEGAHPAPKPRPKNTPQSSNSSLVKDKAQEKEPLLNETHLKQVGEVNDYPNKKSVTSKSIAKVEVKNNDSKSELHKDASLHEEEAKGEGHTKAKIEQTPPVRNAELHKTGVKKEPIKVSKVSHLAKKRLHNKYMTAHVTHPHVVKSHSRVVHKKPVIKGIVCNAIFFLSVNSHKKTQILYGNN